MQLEIKGSPKCTQKCQHLMSAFTLYVYDFLLWNFWNIFVDFIFDQIMEMNGYQNCLCSTEKTHIGLERHK